MEDSIKNKVESTRHKEVLDALKGLSSSINKSNDNSQVAKAIEGNTKEIGNFGKMLGELQIKVEAPNVKVETDLSGVAKSISELKACQERIEILKEDEILLGAIKAWLKYLN